MPRVISDFKQYLKQRLRERRNQHFYDQLFVAASSESSTEAHLIATIAWLRRAQDVKGRGGVAACYNLSTESWGESYRETTGYIINTFLDLYYFNHDEDLKQRAIWMGDWELTQQQADGSFGEPNEQGTIRKKIFNTGQIILGLVALYKLTAESKYLHSAVEAGDWLLVQQEADGSWVGFTTKGANTYHGRVAWALLELATVASQKYQVAAEKNLAWIMSQLQVNHWFNHSGLSDQNDSITHFIAYTISGLLEASRFSIAAQAEVLAASRAAAEVLLDHYLNLPAGQFLSASFDHLWQAQADYSCLTGDAQLADLWLDFFALTKEEKWLQGAKKMIDQLRTCQLLATDNLDLRGGLAGSYPVAGAYGQYMLLNWAAKFYADALLKLLKIEASQA